MEGKEGGICCSRAQEQLLSSFFALERCGYLSMALPLDRGMMALARSQDMG